LLAQLKQEAGWENLSGAIAAAKELAALHSDAVVPALVAELVALDAVDLSEDAGDIGDEVWRTREALIRGLEGCEERAREPLRALLAGDATGAGLAALLVLAKLGDEVAAVVAARWVGQGAAGAMLPLGLLRPPGASRVIIHAIAQAPELNRGWLKRLAGQALGRVGDAEAVAALEVLLDDADWVARLGAVEGLLACSGKQVEEALRRARADVDPRIAKAAKR
jgi:HEAT repeat protein